MTSPAAVAAVVLTAAALAAPTSANASMPAAARPGATVLTGLGSAAITAAAPSVLATGRSTTVRGVVPGGTAATVVEVDQAVGGRWTTVARGRARAGGRYTLPVPVRVNSLRSAVLRTRVGRAGASGTRVSRSVTVSRYLPADGVRLTDAQARGILVSTGMTIYSSGRCSSRTRSSCTSLDTIRTQTIRAAIRVRTSSRCAVQVNGGTEAGHAAGAYSHWTGYKIDLAMTSCVTSYIKRTAHHRGGAYWYQAPTLYFDEASHWDLLVR